MKSLYNVNNNESNLIFIKDTCHTYITIVVHIKNLQYMQPYLVVYNIYDLIFINNESVYWLDD